MKLESITVENYRQFEKVSFLIKKLLISIGKYMKLR